MPEDRASTLWTTPRSPVANTRHCAQFQPTSPSGQSTPLLSPVDATRTMASADEHGSMDVSQCHPRQGEDQGRGTPSTLTRTAHQADQAAGSEGRAQGTPDEESVGSRSCSAESTKSGGLRLTLPCGHTFHRECLGQWLLRSRSCPTCRFDLTEASVHKAAHTARAFAALPDTSSGWARFLRTTMENHEGATVEDTAAGH
uniref:RING-type domain-containing protein n=2 Tax=Rhizochromulina marina TaxID=1034831 RepID=A0A7S2WGZ8_9STRA|mmetsp:Transcript_2347/g.6830  ORF Transcript_2347/g.6830 Transcript_2347/m.6830 type:complete len:200 (+) Transcript_2347:35-634(+)